MMDPPCALPMQVHAAAGDTLNRLRFSAGLMWLLLRVEGSVVGLLVLSWGDRPEAGVQAPVAVFRVKVPVPDRGR